MSETTNVKSQRSQSKLNYFVVAYIKRFSIISDFVQIKDVYPEGASMESLFLEASMKVSR